MKQLPLLRWAREKPALDPVLNGELVCVTIQCAARSRWCAGSQRERGYDIDRNSADNVQPVK